MIICDFKRSLVRKTILKVRSRSTKVSAGKEFANLNLCLAEVLADNLVVVIEFKLWTLDRDGSL